MIINGAYTFLRYQRLKTPAGDAASASGTRAYLGSQDGLVDTQSVGSEIPRSVRPQMSAVSLELHGLDLEGGAGDLSTTITA